MRVKTLVKKFQKLLSDPARQVYILSGIVFGGGILLALWFLSLFFLRGFPKAPRSDGETSLISSERYECQFRRWFDGVCVSDPASASSSLVGIMVENNFEAWPLSGLSKASIVYEAPVEGNIPRFFALYPLGEEVEMVGPVRSARLYFIDWAREYPGLMYLHVGGSPEALFALRAEGGRITNVDAITRRWYYFRH